MSLHVKQALNVKAVNNLFLSFKLFIFHCFDKLDLNHFCSYNFKFLNILRKFSRFPLRRARLLSLSGAAATQRGGELCSLLVAQSLLFLHLVPSPRYTAEARRRKTRAEHG